MSCKKYLDELAILNVNKERLFRKQDPSTWGVPASLEEELKSVKHDSARVYTYMLPYVSS